MSQALKLKKPQALSRLPSWHSVAFMHKFTVTSHSLFLGFLLRSISVSMSFAAIPKISRHATSNLYDAIVCNVFQFRSFPGQIHRNWTQQERKLWTTWILQWYHKHTGWYLRRDCPRGWEPPYLFFSLPITVSGGSKFTAGVSHHTPPPVGGVGTA